MSYKMIFITYLHYKMKPLFGRIGSKRFTAKIIVSKFPTHKTYVELFLGGGGLFRKTPISK